MYWFFLIFTDIFLVSPGQFCPWTFNELLSVWKWQLYFYADLLCWTMTTEDAGKSTFLVKFNISYSWEANFGPWLALTVTEVLWWGRFMDILPFRDPQRQKIEAAGNRCGGGATINLLQYKMCFGPKFLPFWVVYRSKKKIKTAQKSKRKIWKYSKTGRESRTMMVLSRSILRIGTERPRAKGHSNPAKKFWNYNNRNIL